MKKIYLSLLVLVFGIINSQVLNTQTSIWEKAERHLQFKVSDAPNDVLEIGNSTSQNSQFQPTIWVHKESSTGPVMVLSGNIISAVDNGSTPIINLVAGKDIFDNNAPYSSQFPWGDGGTTQPIVNRPVLAVSNAFNRLVTIGANGNMGIATSTPTAKLHTVGNIRFESLPTSARGCPLLLDQFGNAYKSTICQEEAGGGIELFSKEPILNALSTINKIPTYNYSEISNTTLYKSTVDYEVLSSLYPNYKNGKNDDTQIIALLIESIKELKIKIEALEEQLGTKNINSNNGNVKIYPNPVKDNLTIFFAADIKGYVKINIFNPEGRKISNYQLKANNQKVTINVSNLPIGNYLYEVTFDSSLDISRGKFIKE